MKHCFTTLFVAAAAGMAALPASAATPLQIRYSDDKPEMIRMGEEYNYLILPSTARPSQKQNNGIRKEEGAYTLTVNYDYDEELYQPNMFVQFYYDGGGRDVQFLMSGETQVVFDGIPAATGTLMTFFNNVGVPHMPGNVYIFRDVDLTAENEITVKPSDASQIIKFTSVFPNGEEPVLPTVPERYLGEDAKDYTNANCYNVGSYSTIANEKFGGILTLGTNAMESSDDGMTGMENHWIAITPVDDTWHFAQTRWMEDLNHNLYFTHSACLGGQEPVCNAPEFVEYSYEFAVNPISEAFPGSGKNLQGYSCQFMSNGMVDTFNFSFYGADIYRYYLSKPNTADTPWRTSNYGVQFMNVEYDVDIVTAYGTMPDIRSVFSPIGMWNDEDSSVTLLNNSTVIIGSPLWWSDKYEDPCVYPTTQALCLPLATVKYPFGSTAPAGVVTIVADEYDGEAYANLSASYVGMYGECRGADDAMTSVFIEADGVSENCNLDKLSRTFPDLYADGRLNGPFSVEFANDRNILFDGIEGYNFTTINVADGSASDINPPTLTAYQLRNTAGTVDNQFDNAADGILYLTGGEFNLVKEEVTGDRYFECEVADLKVECAPDGSEVYEEIPMNLIEENFWMPNMGNFWQGSLSGVKAKTENGWYKLRVTLTDKAGNSQEQVIYPAFKINANSGVAQVTDSNDAPVRYFNLQGIEVGNPEAGQVVIRRQGNNSTKLILK